MSAGEIGIAALWKPLSFLLGVIGALIGTIWAMLTARISRTEAAVSKQEADLEDTNKALNKNYYDKDETTKMILLHTNPLKEAIDRQTLAIDRLCDKLDKLK